MTEEASSPSSELLLRPVRGGNAFEETVQRLLQTVRLGLVAPGEKLPAERELAAMLAVSRDTLRDAIASLSEAGYLVSRRGRYGGTFVNAELPAHTPAVDENGELVARRRIPPEEIEDTLILREILEVGAARHAAARGLSQVERELLWTSLTEMRGTPVDEYRRLDSRLHVTIAELAGSPSLVPLIADVRMRVNELLDHIPPLAPNLAHSDAQHERIVLAILTGDAERAATAMREHVEGSAALLRGFLQ